MKLRLFKLHRKLDVHGNSGTGQVATIVVIPSGKAIMWWDNSPIQSITIYDSITNIEELHGHQGASTVKEIEGEKAILTFFGFDAKEVLKPPPAKKASAPKKKKAKDGKEGKGTT